MRTALTRVVSLIGCCALWWASPATAQGDPSFDERLRQAEGTMALIERVCLSGYEVKGDASIKAEISSLKNILKKGLDGELSAGAAASQARGAVGIAGDKLKLEENNSIRDCTQKLFDKVLNFLLTGNASQGPNVIELAFTLRPDVNDPTLRPDRVILGQKTPQRLKERYVALEPTGWFTRDIPVPTPQRPFEAFVTRTAFEGTVVRPDLPVTKICAERAVPDPSTQDFTARLHCTEGRGCRRDSARDPGWVKICQKTDTGFLPSFDLFGTAHAQDMQGKVWRIPSLATLRERNEKGELQGMGYTDFSIVSLRALDTPADAFTYRISVNGVPVRIDGLEAIFLSEAMPQNEPLEIAFGLQNLSFSGTEGGCDRIAIEIVLMAKGEPLGTTFKLERRYAALRHASTVKVESHGETFTWSGRYVRPKVAFDNELFVGSMLIRNADGQATSIEDEVAVARTAKRANEWKQALDRRKITFRDQPIVGVVRPPLRKPIFGLVLGLVEPTQQVRFTFDYEMAKSFRAAAMENRSRDASLRRLLGADAFIYEVSKDFKNEYDFCSG